MTVPELLALDNLPVVAIDQESIFTFINEAFTREYGWSSDDLIGKPVMKIMPPHMRNAHMVGFSRYLTTEKSELLGKPLALTVCYKDGREKIADHYILGEKLDGRWRFAAIIDYPKIDG
jgi:PAS domain S-box-containing protein